MGKLIIREKGQIIQQMDISKDVYTIGREPDCDIVLNDSNVSRRHAKLTIEPNKIWIEDLGSSNGISANGQKTKRHDIQPNDEIGIAKFTLVYQPDQPPPEDHPTQMLAGAPEELDKTIVVASSPDADATRVFAPEEKPQSQPPLVKLVVMGGPQNGQEYVPAGGENTIGRSEECQIILDDKRVSRHHAKWVVKDRQSMIQNWESYNGISVNGEKVKEKILTNNDTIEIGPFKLKFVDEGARQKKQSPLDFSRKLLNILPASWQRPPVVMAGGLLLALILAGLVLSLFTSSSKHSPKNKSAPKGSFLQEGIESYKNQEWQKAIEKFQTALDKDPHNESIQGYLSKAQEAISFTAGQKEFESKNWEAAALKFSQVLAINPQQEKAKEYLTLARKNSTANKHYQQGKQDFGSGEWGKAIEGLEAAIDLQPDHQEARSYLEKAKGQLASE